MAWARRRQILSGIKKKSSFKIIICKNCAQFYLILAEFLFFNVLGDSNENST